MKNTGQNTEENTQACRSPINGAIYVERPLASRALMQECIERAHQAQSDWRELPLAQRQDFCRNMLRHFAANEAQIAEEICWQMGRPIRYAAGEVKGFIERAETMIELSDSALADIPLADKAGFKRLIKREPLGVVFVVAPWNYPYLTAVNSIVPALLAGNTVILKHSAQTPLCAERIAEAFEAAGLPQGVFQYLHLDHAQVAECVANPLVNHIAFTGSVSGGQHIERAAAGHFKSLGLELGGKDAAYVRADADLDLAVEAVVDGAFFNSGQSCCGIERAYVHEAVYDAFIEAAVAAVKGYQVGRPDKPETTLGPLVKPAAARFVQGQIDAALEQGAVAHISNTDFPQLRGLNEESGGAYLAPQLLSEVDHSMSVMRDESFGPVLGVQKVCSDDEAVGLINDSDLGLTAAVFSQDEAQAMMIAERLEVGTVFMNRCDYLDPELAWTGVKQSGKGCTLSRLGFESLTRPKSFHFKLNGAVN